MIIWDLKKLYLLRSKDEAENVFYTYKAEVENQLNRNIKRIRSDRGGEYISNTWKEFYEKNGIIMNLQIHTAHNKMA